MGADLLGYIVFGPSDGLNEKNKKSAIEHVTKVVNLACEMEKAVEPDEEDDKTLAILTGFPADLIDIEILERWSMLDPVKVVDDLYSCWNDRSERDIIWREVPGDDTRTVMMAGEMSWGDEPEGSGYTALRNADHMGLFPIVGLE